MQSCRDNGDSPEGDWLWPLLAATVGLSGFLFILLGVIAEVQARIYFEVRDRPPYKVKRIVETSTSPARKIIAGRW